MSRPALRLVLLPFRFLDANPFERRIRLEICQPLHTLARGRFGILQPLDGCAFLGNSPWRAGLFRRVLRRGNIGGTCIFSVGFQHCDDGATRLGAYLHEGVDGGVIDLHTFLGEEFRNAPVCGPALAFGRDELPVRFEFGGFRCHRKTDSNNIQQMSNTFEHCLSLLEARFQPLVAVQGKMSVSILAGEGRSQNEARSSVGTGTHWKGGRRCFG